MPNYNWNTTPMSMSYSSNPYQQSQYNNYLNRLNQEQQQVYTNQYNNTTSNNNIIWVKGKENARSMQLPPNSTVILLDSEVGKFYIKTTDDIGLGKIRIFSYVEQPDNGNGQSVTSNSNLDLSNYVTKEQFERALKEMKKDNEQPVSTIKQTAKSKQFSSTTNKQF